jgi:hypothetical protein
LKLFIKQNAAYFCVIAIIFAVSAAAWVLVRGFAVENAVAEVYKNGVLTHKIELSYVGEDYEIVVGEDSINVILVRHGEIGVIYADCPTQICVNTGFISNGVIPVICIPNRLEIRIVNGANELELDAVAR